MACVALTELSYASAEISIKPAAVAPVTFMQEQNIVLS